MDALIFAGGQGTRMRPFSFVLPKPLMTINDRPILELIFEYLHTAGIRRVFVTIRYLGHLIETYFKDGHGIPQGLEVIFLKETFPLGTAGSLRLLPLFSSPLLLMNADLLTNVDLAKMHRLHRYEQATMTVCTHKEYHQIAYGTFQVSSTGQVVNIQEKPTTQYWINRGIYLLERAALNYLPAETRIDMPELIRALLQAGEPVIAYECENEEFWFDIGNFDAHQQASEHFLKVQEQLLAQRRLALQVQKPLLAFSQQIHLKREVSI